MALALLVAALMLGCGSTDLACVDVALACAPLYEPTFENVYQRTLIDKCGSERVACHSDAGRKGGMTFATIDSAYAALTEPGSMRVIAGDPSCSEAVKRMATTDRAYQMPPGATLSTAEQCAIQQWISGGALRTPVRARTRAVFPWSM